MTTEIMRGMSSRKQVHMILEDGFLPTINQLDNGLVVSEREVPYKTLLIGLLKMLEPIDIINVIGSDHKLLNNIVEPFIEQSNDPIALNEVFKILLQRVENETRIDILIELFKTLTTRTNVAQLNEQAVIDLLESILKNLNKLEDEGSFVQLFNVLLNKVHIANSHSLLVDSVLREVSIRVQAETNLVVLRQLFLQLLSNIHLDKLDDQNRTLVAKVLKLLINRISVEDNTEYLYELLKIMKHKIPKSWIREALSDLVGNQKLVRSPILPKKCILYQELMSTSKVVVIEVEKQKFDVVYHTRSVSQVGHPKLIFAFYVLRDQVTKAEIFAVKDTIIKSNTKLYRYPFSNVFDDFRACWPDLKNIEIKDLSQLSTLPFLFINSPSNDHQFKGTNLYELFLKLSGADFDDSLLTDTGMTFGYYFDLDDSTKVEEHLREENLEYEELEQ